MEVTTSKHLVFVYGTLRRGGVRSMPDLFPGSRFLGHASVSGGLYDMGAHPRLLLDEPDSSAVGEVYEVDDEVLNRLDEIEASSDYGRKQVEASVGSRKMECWVYVDDSESRPGGQLIASGDWIEHARTKA